MQLGVVHRIGPHDLSTTLAEMGARAPHFIASIAETEEMFEDRGDAS